MMGRDKRKGIGTVDGGWIPVSRSHNFINRNSCSGDEHFFTLYIDNLPDNVSHQWLWKTFNDYGVVKDAFIPSKRSKISGNKFGFIRYDCSVSADVAIRRANGLWIDDKKLFVKRASFEQGSKSKINVYGNDNGVSRNFDGHLENIFSKKTSNSGASSAFNLKGASTGYGKSFALVVKGDTNDRVAKERDGKTLNFEPVGNDWLNCSAVAKLHKLIAIEDLEIEFRNQKVEGSLVRAMGGRYLLITFPSKEVMDLTIKETWLSRWFSKVKPWSVEAANLERIVWVKCLGVPLSLWCLNTFKKIGDIWGEFISIDEDTMDMTSFVNGRVLIATEKDFIDEWINIQANNKVYRVRVQEEPHVRKLQLSRIADQIPDFSVEVENINEVEASNASLANKCDLSSGSESTEAGVADLNYEMHGHLENQPTGMAKSPMKNIENGLEIVEETQTLDQNKETLQYQEVHQSTETNCCKTAVSGAKNIGIFLKWVFLMKIMVRVSNYLWTSIQLML